MKFTKIDITYWRGFRNLSIEIPADAGVVCIVGENGTGKTSLFELIASVANRLGLTPGVTPSRSDPFTDRHDFLIRYRVDLSKDTLFAAIPGIQEQYSDVIPSWDQTLSIRSVINPEDPQGNRFEIYAGVDATNFRMRELGAIAVRGLQSISEVLYLSLDADRSYPPVGWNSNQFAQELQASNLPQIDKGRSFARSSTMYEEWERMTLVSYNRIATQFYEETRKAVEAGLPSPNLYDHFQAYREAISRVLPHLKFVGPNSTNNGLLFNSSGVDLNFSKLSGGEREISFIIGQIERFHLRSGLLLIDEPELHLNPDLVRTWIGYLRDNVENGQIWIATHSMEAVESSGAEYTFVLMRDPDSRLVTSASSLASQPLIATLSAALGTPGFSIRQLSFIFVEGTEESGEPQRFYDIYGDSRFVRFIGSGGSRDVIRRHQVLISLAEASHQQLFSGGIIDKDFKSPEEVETINAMGLYVLPFHEIENVYLDPETLSYAAKITGNAIVAQDVVRNACDVHAGRWIFQRAMHLLDYDSELPRSVREAREKTWISVNTDRVAFINTLAEGTANDKFTVAEIASALSAATSLYETLRLDTYLWRECFGKEVFRSIAPALGYGSFGALQKAITLFWNKGHVRVPSEILALRHYLATSLTR